MDQCTCAGYNGGLEKRKCVTCFHPPGKHENLSKARSISSFALPSISSTKVDSGMVTFSVGPKSTYPQTGCKEDDDFNMSQQQDYMCRQKHVDMSQNISLADIWDADDDGNTETTESGSSQWPISIHQRKPLTLSNQQSPFSPAVPLLVSNLHSSDSSTVLDDISDSGQDSKLYSA